MNIKSFTILCLTILVMSCQEFKVVPDEKFIGVWELSGRSMFDGIRIRIQREDGKLTGKIEKLNDNKLVKLFAEVNDVWVSEIKRTSNFEFDLTEKKIARDLFSIYGQSTSQEFEIQFIDDNTIGLGANHTDPRHSKIVYKRIE